MRRLLCLLIALVPFLIAPAPLTDRTGAPSTGAIGGDGGVDTGPIPDCGPGDDLQDGDGDCISALTDASDADALHTHDLKADIADLAAYLLLAGGTMDAAGHIVLPDNTHVAFGTGSDAVIFYDSANLHINPQLLGGGYTDFTGALRVAEHEAMFSMVGGDPTSLNPSNVLDMFVVRKLRNSGVSASRTGLFVLDVESDDDMATPQMGINSFVYTGESNSGGNTRGTEMGGAIGGRYGFRHGGSGNYLIGGGVSAITSILGTAEDGTIDIGYAFMDEGGDGGAGTGGITIYDGFWIRESIGNIVTKHGIYIEDLTNADDDVGIRLNGADTFALWFANSSGTSNDGIWFGGCVDLYNTGGPPQTLGVPDLLCDSDGATSVFATADTNFYRSAADTLKTDDSLIVGDDLTVTNDIHGLIDTKCVHVMSPQTNEQIFKSVWRAPYALTIKELWCESDAGTVEIDMGIDDGDPDAVNGSYISCAVSPGTPDSDLAGDVTMGVDDRLDIDIGTVVTAIRLSACWKFEVD